jgi:hypothetical protein
LLHYLGDGLWHYSEWFRCGMCILIKDGGRRKVVVVVVVTCILLIQGS